MFLKNIKFYFILTRTTGLTNYMKNKTFTRFKGMATKKNIKSQMQNFTLLFDLQYDPLLVSNCNATRVWSAVCFKVASKITWNG